MFDQSGHCGKSMLCGMKTKRVELALLLAGVAVGHAALLGKGPWWTDGACFRTAKRCNAAFDGTSAAAESAR